MIAHHLAQLGRHLLERERILAAPDRLCVRCVGTQSWLAACASGRIDSVIACKGRGAEEGFQGLMIYICFTFRGSPCWLFDEIMHLLGMDRYNVYAHKPIL